MADVQVTFGANIEALTAAAKQGSAAVSDLADQVKAKFDGIRDVVAAAAAAFGVGFGADAIKNWIQGEAELGEQIHNAAAKLGTTAQQASQLSGIAALTGTSFDALQSDMVRFQVGLASAQDPTSRVAQALKALGLSAKEFIGIPIPQQIELLAAAAQKFADGPAKTAAFGAVNRSFIEMLPLLDRGKEGIEQLEETVERTGSVMSNDMVASFAKTDENIQEMGLAWQGLSNKIFDVVNPSIDSAIQKFTQWVESIKEDQIRAAFEKIGDVATQGVVIFEKALNDAEGAWKKFTAMLSAQLPDPGEALHNFALNLDKSFYSDLPFTGNIISQLDKDIAASNDRMKGTLGNLSGTFAEIDTQTAAANSKLTVQAKQWQQTIRSMFAGSSGEAGTEAAKLQSLLDRVNQMLASNKPQAGTMQIGEDKGAEEALEAQISALNEEIAHYKSVEQQKQSLIEEEVKTKTLSAQQGREAVEAALQSELQSSMAVYQQEASLLQGQPRQLQEVLNKEKELQDQYAAEIQKLNVEAAEQTAQAWQKGFEEINSAFDSQISGLIKGTTSWQKAFQNILTSLLTDAIKFFVNLGLQSTENTVLQLLNIGKVQTADLTSQELMEAAHASSGATSALAGLGQIATQVKASAGETFAGVFGFLAPVMGPAAAGPAAAAEATVIAQSYAFDKGSWELPSDMIAQVHQGEMIVPAAQTPWAQALMANATGAGGNVVHHNVTLHNHINGAQNPSDIADAIQSKMKEIGRAYARATGTKLPRFA